MINFEHVSARSEAEALELLGPNGSSSLIAGGTDLLVLIKEGIAQPQRVIDIKGLGTLRGITPDGGALRLGALTTLTEIEESDQLRQGYTV
ncbi:MAG: FAD binding domain-containing protein, partial [Chloroflexota bacterium]|nr:FAD binding domain-containing protein [Chloroflexota bacterium]